MNFQSTLEALSESLHRQLLSSQSQVVESQTIAAQMAWQHQQMPEHLRIGIWLFTHLFNVSGIRRGKLFQSLGAHEQDQQLAAWRISRVGACRDLVRFYESLFLLIALSREELEH